MVATSLNGRSNSLSEAFGAHEASDDWTQLVMKVFWDKRNEWNVAALVSIEPVRYVAITKIDQKRRFESWTQEHVVP
jgi:hypothetical protein